MKIQLLSDLHIEFSDFEYQETDCDLVILAGDIHIGEKGVSWALEHIKNKPVLFVAGNHEFYGKAYPKHLRTLRALTEGTNVHLLENEVLTLKGVNFFGCTLWTNFELYGDPRVAGHECQQVMNDFKRIKLSTPYRKLRSRDIASIHYGSVKWLKAQLCRSSGKKNLIITHHAPSQRSIPTGLQDDSTNPAYASNLEELILEYNPQVWIHGHLHNSSDYRIGQCRILCNPRGYPDEVNREFDPGFCFDV